MSRYSYRRGVDLHWSPFDNRAGNLVSGLCGRKRVGFMERESDGIWGSPVLRCPYCGKAYQTDWVLNYHIHKAHHGADREGWVK